MQRYMIGELSGAGFLILVEELYGKWGNYVPLRQETGYRVRLIFLCLPDLEIALERVRIRVVQGGHSVEESVIRCRFDKGWNNFHNVYRDLVDSWVLYDNSAENPQQIGEREKTIQHPDLARVDAALLRAVARAREIARRTRTPLIVYKDGKVRSLKVYDEDILTTAATTGLLTIRSNSGLDSKRRLS